MGFCTKKTLSNTRNVLIQCHRSYKNTYTSPASAAGNSKQLLVFCPIVLCYHGGELREDWLVMDYYENSTTTDHFLLMTVILVPMLLETSTLALILQALHQFTFAAILAALVTCECDPQKKIDMQFC